MKKFLKDGFFISRADRLAVANDLIESLEDWAYSGPKHLVTYKPVNQILKKDLKLLKAKKEGENKNLPADLSVCIEELCSLPEFKKKNLSQSGLLKPKRKQSRDEKILANGIDVEDHEYTAAINYWKDPEELLIDLLENKIARCKERFVLHWTKILIADSNVSEIPTNDDDLIEMVILRPDYKNRVQRDEEIGI